MVDAPRDGSTNREDLPQKDEALADFLGHDCIASLLPMVKLQEDPDHTPDPHTPVGVQPPVGPLTCPHQPGDLNAFAVTEEALLIEFNLHNVKEPIAVPRDAMGVPLASGGMPFGVFLDIKVQTPEALHFRKNPLV
jgi:hypothetical protein